ncbi:MAG: hypothetical protein K2Y01_10320 [Rhabdochlamydiaceae bacterium]|nr:hypothetical protein [Rhabdochlamydiaceae bacterium]
MFRTVGNGVKDITLGAASCIPIIGPCVVVPARFIATIVCTAGKVAFYGVKAVVMVPVKTGSAIVKLFHRSPK